MRPPNKQHYDCDVKGDLHNVNDNLQCIFHLLTWANLCVILIREVSLPYPIR